MLVGVVALLFGGGVLARLYLAFGVAWIPILWRKESVRARWLTWVPVGLIVGLALLVRLWGVNFGLPYLEHVDEWAGAERALHIVQTGNFDPLDYHHPALPDNDRQAFTYPGLYTYLQTGVFSIHFLQGVTAGRYEGTSNLNDPLVKAAFYQWGRSLTALLGAATVLLVFLLGRRYYGGRAGVVGALFLCFFYLHALNSHWITTDVPSGFFALWPFFWIYRISAGEERKRTYLLAGLLCGLAMGSKYNNLLIFLPVLLAHFTGRSSRRWLNWNLLIVLAATFGGFFVSSPFIFFHLPNFFTDLAAIINHYQNVGHPGFEGATNWSYYIGAMWDENAAVVALGLSGVLLAFARHRRTDLILLTFPVFSYLQLSGYKVNFTRNLMPIVPFLTIFAGWFLVSLVERVLRPKGLVRWQVLVLAILAGGAIISPALTILEYDRYNAQPTNRARATAWVQEELPRGSKLW
ncbi:MAG: glycosyltransferase family 39 protein, partial [Chloroflexota bacterium]